MCGELDGEDRLEGVLYERFLAHARALLDEVERRRPDDAGGDGLHAYMDSLFAAALSRSAKDAEHADDAGRYRLMTMQSLVFARLAGFLAAHASLHEDPLRRVMEALMHGYAEAERIAPSHGHHHDHDHDHGHHHHDHGDGHHHHHH